MHQTGVPAAETWGREGQRVMTTKQREWELLILAADLYVERIHDRLCYAQTFYARSAKDQRAIAILSGDLSDAVNVRNLLNDLKPESEGRGA